MNAEHAIVVGSAPTVFDELRHTMDLLGDTPYDVIATNYAGILLPGSRLRYWCSHHTPELIEWSKRRRKERPDDPPFQTVAANGGKAIDIVTRDNFRKGSPSGSSSLFSTLWALRCGYDRVIVCGVPLAGSRTIGPAPTEPYEKYRSGWQAAYDRDLYSIRDLVRATSGFTRKLLGDVTNEWLR